jgi:hypothetical protein
MAQGVAAVAGMDVGDVVKGAVEEGVVEGDAWDIMGEWGKGFGGGFY